MKEANFIKAYQKKIKNNSTIVHQRQVFLDIAIKVAHIQENENPKIKNPLHLILKSEHVYPKIMQLTNHETNMTSPMNSEKFLYYLNPKMHSVIHTISDFQETDTPTKNIINNDRTLSTISNNISSEKYDYLLDEGVKLILDARKNNTNCISFGSYQLENIWFAKIVSIITNVELEKCLPYKKNTTKPDVELIEHIRNVHQKINPLTVKDIIQQYGNEELVVLIGALLEALKQKIIILIDNACIATAVLLAYQIDEKVIDFCIFTNNSPSKYHQKIIDYFEKKSILNLEYTSNIGEGIAIALPIINGALRWFSDLKNTRQ